VERTCSRGEPRGKPHADVLWSHTKKNASNRADLAAAKIVDINAKITVQLRIEKQVFEFGMA